MSDFAGHKERSVNAELYNMICPRCKAAMIELKRTFHKQRKWVCPDCGRVRFQKIRPQVPRRITR